MAVLKCKMCGGDLNVTEDSNVVKCEFCDTTQTVLMPDNEKKTNLYNRANRLRFANEFDKAAGVFESLVAEFPEEAEAYWGLCLCKYGIEYVDDPATGKKIPTCHRTSYESIFDDQNFELALEYADSVANSIYREEAKIIDRIQKGILEIVSKEEPFDIFICYKETDEKGERTIDSVLAQDIYDKLTEKGYKVFFSRITLEDKLGQEYEPYIFSALNSAKIMLVIGTKYEYFEAVWVKNEWSRFLDLMKKDKDKTLIPCYRDIDAYDMPREFKNLQGQNMGNVGYLQDLIRGIGKLMKPEETKDISEQTVTATISKNTKNLLKRGKLALEDGDWEKADDFFEQALNQNAEESKAYLGKVLAYLNISDINLMSDLPKDELNAKAYGNFKRAIQFASDDELTEIKNVAESIVNKYKETDLLKVDTYESFLPLWEIDTEENEQDIPPWEEPWEEIDTEKNEQDNNESFLPPREIDTEENEQDIPPWEEPWEEIFAEENEQDNKKIIYIKDINDINESLGIYTIHVDVYDEIIMELLKRKNDTKNKSSVSCLLERAEAFLSDSNWIMANRYCKKVLDIDEKNANAYLYRLMSYLKISKPDDIVCFGKEIENYYDYKKAYNLGDDKFKEMLDTYGNQVLYNEAAEMLDNAVTSLDCERSKKIFEKLGDFKDSAEKAGYCDDKINQILYNEATEIIDNAVRTSDCEEAKEKFEKLGNFKDSAEKAEYCNNKIKEIKDRIEKTYNEAVDLYNSGDYKEATLKFSKCENTKDTLKYLTNILKNNISVACGTRHTVGLKSNGTVVAAGSNDYGQCNVSNWKDIVSIVCGYLHTVGLESDGTVVATGVNEYAQCNVSNWKDIVSVACGYGHTVGLKSDGTVIATGSNGDGQCNVTDWKDIVSIACGNGHTVGLKSDGTVVATGYNEYGQCNVSDWRDIVFIACGLRHTVGLKSDGTVIATGSNGSGQCNVTDWKDIVSIACGSNRTAGLKSDGTVVVAKGFRFFVVWFVSDWKDIVSIACRDDHIAGLKIDGTVVASGDNNYGQCDVQNWRNIGHFTNFKKFLKVKENIENAERERINKIKAKIKELEEIKRNKNEYKSKLNEQLKEISKEINKVNSNLENIGLALFGKKAAMRKEMKDKLDSLNKNEQDINVKLSRTESELTDLQEELGNNYSLL